MQLKFLVNSLWHYRKSHLGVLAGTVVGATVLLGALFAGDSVSGALKRLASLRVGQAEYLLTVGDRFVREDLSSDLERGLGIPAAPALMLRGSASRSDRDLLAPNVQALGVDARFWSFSPSPDGGPDFEKANAVAVNQRLADRLQLEVGDAFVLRIEKPGLLSRDAPLSGSKDNVIGIRVTVSDIRSDDQYGRFSLQANQISPFTVFAPIEWIQDQIERKDRANLILLGSRGGGEPVDDGEFLSSIEPYLTLEDYGLSTVDVPLSQSTEISSERVFIDEAIVAAVQSSVSEVQPVITYLANTLRVGEKETPYSMVTAAGQNAAPFLGSDLDSSEATITSWLADDLGAEVGDSLDLSYYVIDESSELVEETTSYTIRAVLPHEGLVADQLWMPDFPGVAGAEDSADWDAGMPLDLDRIREKDEDYWDDYKGAPKAFISLETGEQEWANRWGVYTALRVPTEALGKEALRASVLSQLDPRMIGARTLPFRKTALDSAVSPVDIGGLFISMSFFLIVASLSLVAMLFSFSMQQVNRENALLVSLGIGPKRIGWWRLLSSFIIVHVGTLLALPLAAGYTWGILRFLETIWSSDSTGSLFAFQASSRTIAIGVLANMVLALATIWYTLRRQSKTQASFRLQQGSEETVLGQNRKRGLSLIVGICGIVFGGVTLILSLLQMLPIQVGYFLAGFCWLIGGIGICASRIGLDRGSKGSAIDATRVGRLNNGRRPMRSLTVVGTLACGVFLVVSVAAFRKEKDTSGNDPKNGYGGFSFWAETSIPLSDPADYSGPDNLFDVASDEAIAAIRIGEGDDASCFNLNQTANPRLLGMSSDYFQERGAFTFHSIREGLDASQGWNLLKADTDSEAIPAFIDSATLQWALKRKLGDRLTYTDSAGRPFEVELVGAISDTVFQGSILIDERALLEKYPQHEGYQLFLIDDWGGSLDRRRAQLESWLSPWGGQVEIAYDRLQAYHEVENTYIAIFHVLGGLGVILGSAGLGVVVARNLSERRHEFALLDAIGIPSTVRKKIVFSELRSLVGWGVGVGLCAAVVSIIPSMSHLGVAAPVFNLSLLIVAILLNAAFWSYIGYRGNAPVVADLQRDFES